MHRFHNPSRAVHMENADALYEEYRKARDAFYRAYDSGDFDTNIVIHLLVLLAMLRIELRNLDGTYTVGPLNEDLDDINKKYTSMKTFLHNHMERVVPEDTFEFLVREGYRTGWDSPPGFAMWKKSRDKTKRRSHRAPRRSSQDREIMEEYLETGDEELVEDFREAVTVSPEARRYAPKNVEIRPQRAARRGAAKRLAKMQLLADQLRLSGDIKEYVEAQQSIAELMARYDLSEEEVRAYREEMSP